MHASKNQERKDFIKAALLVLFLLLVFTFMILKNPNNEDSKVEAVKANIKSFNDGETLICGTSVFKYSVNYQVSKNRGWSIERHSFAKGDMLIDINECQNSSVAMTTKKGDLK